ncbi:cytochrome P450 2C23-like, partial [Phascolarctos cinereus]
VILSRGERWKQHRRFTLMTLRNFGMGKRSVEERVQEEAQCLVEELRKTKGQPTDPTFILSCVSCNVICSILFRDRFKYDDEKFLYLMNLLNENFHLFNKPWTQLYNFLPAFRAYLPGEHKRILKINEELKDFILERVKEHQKVLDPNNPQDYIDYYLSKMQQEKDNAQTEFDLENVKMTGVDLFSAGTETSSSTLRYGLLLILKYPEVQGKRSCAGEGLAKMEVFLFLTTILQNFTLKPVGDPNEIRIKPNYVGFSKLPPCYQLCFLPH